MISGSLDISALTQAIDQADRAAADWSEPFEPMGEAVRADYAQRFARKGPGWGTDLVKTGALRESFVTLGAPGNVAEIGAEEASFGSDLPYAETVQTGAGSNAPARPIARQTAPALVRELSNEAVQHIERAFDGLPQVGL